MWGEEHKDALDKKYGGKLCGVDGKEESKGAYRRAVSEGRENKDAKVAKEVK